jgi:hypothetical protein
VININIIFLDIDGVLNTGRYIEFQYIENNYKAPIIKNLKFDPICMENLKELITETNSYIVISSTWRIHKKEFDNGEVVDRHWNTLIRNFNEYELHNKIIGVTPILNDIRCNEIKKWLYDYYKEHKKDINFIIIDDDAYDMGEFTDTKLAKCVFKTGLTDEVKNKAKDMLLNKKQPLFNSQFFEMIDCGLDTRGIFGY